MKYKQIIEELNKRYDELIDIHNSTRLNDVEHLEMSKIQSLRKHVEV